MSSAHKEKTGATQRKRMAEILCSIEQAVRELVDVMRCGNKKVNESRRQWGKLSWQGRNK